MSDQAFDLPYKSPSVPVLLGEQSTIQFRCYPGISCFNACCRSADITLTPYDILRLKTRLGLSSEVFLKNYTVPFQMDQDGVPGVKLRTDDEGACLQLKGDQGCGVYEDRPIVCRYYPVGLLNIREKGSAEAREQYSLIEEGHCQGHHEARDISIGDYRKEQGCHEYDEVNREWYQIILKKKSAGPGVGRPSEMSLQLFFMASYNLDMFRRFVLSQNFKSNYDLPEATYEILTKDDLELLRFAFRLLRQVLFNEKTIPEYSDAWDKRVEQRREIWDLQAQSEVQRRQQLEDDKYKTL